MVKINLLPAEFVAEQRRKLLQNRCLLAVLPLVALLFCISGNLYCLAQQMAAEITVMQKQLEFVEREVEKYGPFLELQRCVSLKKNLLAVAMGAEFGWREMLAALETRIPTNVRLTNLELVFNGLPGTLTLYGMTDSHPAAAGWAEALEAVPGISGVQISFSTVEQGDDGKQVRFKLWAQIFSRQPAGWSEK
ncbi:MAG: PilN domain-containing protein [Firmicutes bacterium]|jgi:Tfp pilus assembly protein PilN|nr:PilN domain-containing protein [Bacillota bacterium]